MSTPSPYPPALTPPRRYSWRSPPRRRRRHPPSAGIWTEIPSGTTQNITAIEYQSATRFWFTTAGRRDLQAPGPTGSFEPDARARRRAAERHRVPGRRADRASRSATAGWCCARPTAATSWSPAPASRLERRRPPTARAPRPLGDVNAVRFAGNGARVAVRRGLSRSCAPQPVDPARSSAPRAVGRRQPRHAGHAERRRRHLQASTRPTATPASRTRSSPRPNVGYIVAGQYSEGVLHRQQPRVRRGRRSPRDAGNAGTTGAA